MANQQRKEGNAIPSDETRLGALNQSIRQTLRSMRNKYSEQAVTEDKLEESKRGKREKHPLKAGNSQLSGKEIQGKGCSFRSIKIMPAMKGKVEDMKNGAKLSIKDKEDSSAAKEVANNMQDAKKRVKSVVKQKRKKQEDSEKNSGTHTLL